MMKKFQLTTVDGRVIAHQVAVADSWWPKLVGLMFRKELAAGTGLVLTPCKSIHMFFMRIALDVIFVDREGVVVYLLPDLKPWRISRVVSKARTVIELPAGTLAKNPLQLGQVLRLADQLETSGKS